MFVPIARHVVVLLSRGNSRYLFDPSGIICWNFVSHFPVNLLHDRGYGVHQKLFC